MDADAVAVVALELRHVPQLLEGVGPASGCRVLVDPDSHPVVGGRIDPDDVAGSVAVPVSQVDVAAVDVLGRLPEIGHPWGPVRLAAGDLLLPGVGIHSNMSVGRLADLLFGKGDLQSSSPVDHAQT